MRDKGLLSWEEAVRKITSLPADIVGIKGRGRIANGYHADIVVFDPEKIRDQAVYQNPYLPSLGIEYVIVNGRLALEKGNLTGAMAGSVLRKS